MGVRRYGRRIGLAAVTPKAYLSRMGFHGIASENRSGEKLPPRSKYRVWDFFATFSTSVWNIVTQPVASHQETFDTTTIFVSGALYYGYRYYAPGFGRWVSRDPIREKGGHNLYGMTGNAPLTRLDRLGLVTFDYRPANIINMRWYSMPEDDLGDAGDAVIGGDAEQHVRVSGRCVQQLNLAGNCECRLQFTIREYDKIVINEMYAGDASIARLIYGHEQRHIQSMRRELDRLGDMLAIEEARTPLSCSQCQDSLRIVAISAGFFVSRITRLESSHMNMLSPGQFELIPPIDNRFPPSSGDYVPITPEP